MTVNAPSSFPAILLGGPPNAGKSVLSNALSQVLRKAGVPFYLLHAAPDGEGYWFYLAPEVIKKKLRESARGEFTYEWVEVNSRDIAQRTYPFLVDVGGKPKPWQETIFAQCSHAILLVKDAETEQLWRNLMAKYPQIEVIAILHSQLEGESQLETDSPIIQGTITGLDRQAETVSGPVFEAVVDRVKALFNYQYQDLLVNHRNQLELDLVIDIPQMATRLRGIEVNYIWQPTDLPDVLDYLPNDTPLALYGRGPVWLYTTVATHLANTEFYQFDMRCGWLKPITFNICTTPNDRLPLQTTETDDYLILDLTLPNQYTYLPYREILEVTLPSPNKKKGVILSGRAPIWLFTSLARFYHQQSCWIAVYDPRLHGAVVVSTLDTKETPVGKIIPL